MKNSTRNFILKFFSILLITLFSLWLGSPFITQFILKSQLPQQWKLTSFDMDFPGFRAIEITDLALKSDYGDMLQLNHVTIAYPWFSRKIAIESMQMKSSLQTSSSSDKSSGALPQINPITVPVDLAIKRLQIQLPGLSINGALQLTAAESHFSGQLQWHEKEFPLTAKIEGFDGVKDLRFSLLSQQQRLLIHHPWKSDDEAQQLHIQAQLGSEFLQSLSSILIKKIPDFNLLHPSLTLDTQIFWKKYPDIQKQFSDMKIQGKMELGYEKIQLPDLEFPQNKINIQFSNTEYSMITDQNLISNANYRGKIFSLYYDSDTPFTLERQQNRFTLKNATRFKVTHQHQLVHLKIDALNVNEDFSELASTIAIDGQLQMSEFIKLPTPLSLQSFTFKNNIEINKNQQRWNIISNQFTVQNPAIFWQLENNPKISIEDLSINSSPITLQWKPQQSLVQTLLPLEPHLNLEFKSQYQGITSYQYCRFNLAMTKTHLKCILAPEKNLFQPSYFDSKNKLGDNLIRASLDSNFLSRKINLALSASNLSHSKWHLDKFLNDIEIKNWHTDFDIKQSLSLASTPTNTLGLLNETSPDSYVNISGSQLKKAKMALDRFSFNATVNADHQLLSELQIPNFKMNDVAVIADVHLQSKISSQTEQNFLKGTLHSFGGKLSIRSQQLDLNNKMAQLQLQLTQFDLEQLFQWLDITGFKASGKVEGQIPLKINEQGFFVENGTLQATETGKIQYSDPNDSTPFENKNIALQALENFVYSKLSMTIETIKFYFHKQGQYRIPMRIIGSNPELLAGKSIALNPVIEGKIPQKAWQYLTSESIENQIKNRVKH